MRNGYENIDVRQQPEYQELFDFAGELGEQVFDVVGDRMTRFEVEDYEDFLEDLLGAYWQPGAEEGPKSWSPLLPTEVGPQGLHILAEALKEGELNLTDMFIRDSMTFAWEKALLPTDNDIRDALNEAKEKVELDLDLGSIWEPLYDLVPDYSVYDYSGPDGREKIIEALMGRVYWGYGMEGKPIINFSFANAQPVGILRSADKEISMDELNREFVFLRDRLMEAFWEALAKEMKKSDPDNRVEWRAQWREELKDKPKVEAVQKELLEYLKGRRFE